MTLQMQISTKKCQLAQQDQKLPRLLWVRLPQQNSQAQGFQFSSESCLFLCKVNCACILNAVDLLRHINSASRFYCCYLVSSSWLHEADRGYKKASFLETWLALYQPPPTHSQVGTDLQPFPTGAKQQRHVISDALVRMRFNHPALLIKSAFSRL